MKDATKILILKISLIIAVVSGIVFIIFPFASINIVPFRPLGEKILKVLFINFVICGVIFGTLSVIIKVSDKSVKPDIYQMNFNSYEDIFDFLKEKILERKFHFNKTINLNDGQIDVFYQKKIISVKLIVIIRLPELTAENLNEIEVKFDELMKSQFSYIGYGRTVDIINLLCVDRISSRFKTFVNNYDHSMNIHKIFAGYSFGGKKLYLCNYNNGFAILKQKKMYKQILQLFGIAGTQGRGTQTNYVKSRVNLKKIDC